MKSEGLIFGSAARRGATMKKKMIRMAWRGRRRMSKGYPHRWVQGHDLDFPCGCLTILLMPTATFSDFLALLERNNELVRIKTKVSPILEISEITDRACKTPAPHGHEELDRSPAAALGG